MQGHRPYRRLLAAIGAVAVLAVGSSAPSFAGTRTHQPGKPRTPIAHPVFGDRATVQLVSLGRGCGDLEVFVIVQNGHPSLPMC